MNCHEQTPILIIFNERPSFFFHCGCSSLLINRSSMHIDCTQIASCSHVRSYIGDIRPIPSALGSEAPTGLASTTVRENVGSPDDVRFCHSGVNFFAPLNNRTGVDYTYVKLRAFGLQHCHLIWLP